MSKDPVLSLLPTPLKPAWSGISKAGRDMILSEIKAENLNATATCATLLHLMYLKDHNPELYDHLIALGAAIHPWTQQKDA